MNIIFTELKNVMPVLTVVVSFSQNKHITKVPEIQFSKSADGFLVDVRKRKPYYNSANSFSQCTKSTLLSIKKLKIYYFIFYPSTWISLMERVVIMLVLEEIWCPLVLENKMIHLTFINKHFTDHKSTEFRSWLAHLM